MSYVINLDNSQQGKKDQVCRITKVINYEKCRRRPQFSQNTFYGRNCDGCQQVKMESNTLKMYWYCNRAIFLFCVTTKGFLWCQPPLFYIRIRFSLKSLHMCKKRQLVVKQPIPGSEIIGCAKLKWIANKKVKREETGERKDHRPLFLGSRAHIFVCLSLTRHPCYLRALILHLSWCD